MSNKLTCTSNLKRSTLNNISNLSDIAISSLAKSSSYYARARNADIDNTVRLTSTVKSTSHKWVIFRSITENNKLCCTNAISVLSFLGSSLDDASHLSNSIHIDTCFCAANINRRTDIISNRESLGNTLNKSIVTRSKALMHERRISTDKVYTDSFRRFVESFSKFNRIFCWASSRNKCNRSNRYSLVNNRNSIILAYIFACLNKVFCISANLIIDFITGFINIRVDTVEQRDTHSDCTNVEIFVINHTDGFKYIM